MKHSMEFHPPITTTGPSLKKYTRLFNPVPLMIISLFFVFVSFSFRAAAQYDRLQSRRFTQKALQSDLAYLRKALKETHPGLYRYSTKEEMDRRFDSSAALLHNGMLFYDYYGIIAALTSSIRCQHTGSLPADRMETYAQRLRLFPYSLHFVNNRAWFTLNHTADTIIKPGDELIAINDQPLAAIVQTIFTHTPADGYNQTIKEARLNMGMFPFFYYLFVNRPDSFHIRYKNEQGILRQTVTAALPVQQSMLHTGQNPVNKTILKANEKKIAAQQKKLQLEIKKELNTAVLTVRSFGGDAARQLPAFLDTAMRTLKKMQIRNLVIDLRYNGGGSDSAGVLLFTYLIQQPSRYYVRQHTITDSSYFLRFADIPPEELAHVRDELVKEADGSFSQRPEFAAGLPLQYPKADHFTGNIYFLMNGGSGSTTSELIAASYSNRLGIFIGEEDGGCYEGGTGGSFINLTLPQTGITVSIPLLYYDNYSTRSVSQKGRGVIPDHTVHYFIKDVLEGKDPQMDFALELAKQAQ